MTPMEFLELLGSVKDPYILEAQSPEESGRKRLPLRRAVLIAAIISVTLLLVGCTMAVAYTQGWFTNIFAARSKEPLSDSQIEFIENREQIVAETVQSQLWQVELKSTLSDGDTGYVLFGITAPEDVDLEGIHAGEDGWNRIVPGNEAMDHQGRRTLVLPSCGNVDREKNFIWQNGGHWEADHDGKANTLDYLVTLRCERLDPSKEMLLEDPLGADMVFNIRFLDFIHEYEDPEVRKAINEKYAGMTDYMVADEDLVGLHRAEVLVEGTWEFNVSLGAESEALELITGEPVMTWGMVTWKLDDDPIAYETASGIVAVKITSFRLSSFGAELEFEFQAPAFAAFIEYQNHNGYTDRHVYAVMKDGSRIPLHTNGTGDNLSAETPIVLSDLDHILLGDGVTIPIPNS